MTLVLVVLMVVGFVTTNYMVMTAIDSRLDEISSKIDVKSSSITQRLQALEILVNRKAAVMPAAAPAPKVEAAPAAPAPTPPK
jgi:hypothetical protein